MRLLYDGAMELYRTGHKTLFTAGGELHRKNGKAMSFWHGFHGSNMNWDRASRQTSAYAFFRAGQDAAKEHAARGNQ